jgi:hypothetical protein
MLHSSADLRRFGRRRALIHVFAVNSKALHVPCLVRNISMGVALLEVEDPLMLSQSFALIIDADGFAADCEIRHRGRHGVGVDFQDIRMAPNGIDSRLAGPQLVPNMKEVLIGDLRR